MDEIKKQKEELVKDGIRPCASTDCAKPAVIHLALEGKHSVIGLCENHLIDGLEGFLINAKIKHQRLKVRNLRVESIKNKT